jgi:serine protease AprX
MKRIFLHLQAGNTGHGRILPFHRIMFAGALYLFLSQPGYAQVFFEETAPQRYRIEFINKDNNPYSLDNPQAFLSEKSIARRQKQGISMEYKDLPVSPSYIDSIRSTGAEVLTISKWFNSVTIKATSDTILQRIARFTFVKKNVAYGIRTSTKKKIPDTGRVQLFNQNQYLDYGVSEWQTAIHKGQYLHEQGFTGQGVTIAILDAGFYHVDQLPAFAYLWENDQILGTHDFVVAGSNLYNGHSHGMVVLSIMGGNLPGELIGTSPDADFWLLRSEDAGSEYLIEEDNWAAAAEFADSAGADILNTSLGYSQFDDHLMDHSYADMDGNTTRISRAADIAASKGMLVVVSAGNLGAGNWHYISAPADADSVLAVGAIDADGYIADFSSRGPSSDLRVKPDLVAIGKGTWVAGFESGVRQGNGTSLSAPIITGLAACLWQANPEATSMEILTAIRESSDRFTQPDAEYGYGIPDFNMAHFLLNYHAIGSPEDVNIIAFPNPFSNSFYIVFTSPVDDPVDLSLIDLSGREVFHELYPGFAGRKYMTVDGLAGLYKGVYTLKVTLAERSSMSKLIKF